VPTGPTGTFNIAKGRESYYCRIPDTGGAMIGVLLKLAGLQTDAALADHDTLSAVLAANTEANFAGYVRKVYLVAAITVTVNDTDDVCTVDWADPVWALAPASDALGKLLWCYRPASGSADTANIPVIYSRFLETPRGDDLKGVINPIGVWRGREP
jgi:hypothetical protein